MDERKEPTSTPTSHHNHSGPGGNKELMADAKVVADAAKSLYTNHNMNAIDKAKVSEAAKDLYEVGQGYMGGSKSGGHNTTAESAEGGATEHRKEESDEKESQGGFGDYINMAKGFMK